VDEYECSLERRFSLSLRGYGLANRCRCARVSDHEAYSSILRCQHGGLTINH